MSTEAAALSVTGARPYFEQSAHPGGAALRLIDLRLYEIKGQMELLEDQKKTYEAAKGIILAAVCPECHGYGQTSSWDRDEDRNIYSKCAECGGGGGR